MTDPLAWLTDLEGVRSAYAGTRDGIDVLLRDRGLRRTSPEMTAESLLRGAHASAVLEGSAVVAGARCGRGRPTRSRPTPYASPPRCSRWRRCCKTAPLQAIARLHAVVGSGRWVADELGRPRDAASADRLRGVSELLLSGHAGAGAAGRRGRARRRGDGGAVRLAQRHRRPGAGAAGAGLAAASTPSRCVVPEAGHLAHRAAYESNLRAYRDGGPSGVHAWALYGAEAFAAGAEASPLRG